MARVNQLVQKRDRMLDYVPTADELFNKVDTYIALLHYSS